MLGYTISPCSHFQSWLRNVLMSVWATNWTKYVLARGVWTPSFGEISAFEISSAWAGEVFNEAYRLDEWYPQALLLQAIYVLYETKRRSEHQKNRWYENLLWRLMSSKRIKRKLGGTHDPPGNLTVEWVSRIVRLCNPWSARTPFGGKWWKLYRLREKSLLSKDGGEEK